MPEVDRTASGEHFRQVPGQSESRHFGSVAFGVVGSPTRLDRVQVVVSQRGGKQPVTAVDASVE